MRLDLLNATPTTVQLAAVPRLRAGKSVVLIGATGTGKTIAYLLPLLDRLTARGRAVESGSDDAIASDALSLARYYRHGTDGGRVQALILAPTRELAAQIAGV